MEAIPLTRIRRRIKKLTQKRDSIFGNATTMTVDKQAVKLADLDSRIEELGKLLDKRGHKRKTL